MKNNSLRKNSFQNISVYGNSPSFFALFGEKIIKIHTYKSKSKFLTVERERKYNFLSWLVLCLNYTIFYNIFSEDRGEGANRANSKNEIEALTFYIFIY